MTDLESILARPSCRATLDRVLTEPIDHDYINVDPSLAPFVFNRSYHEILIAVVIRSLAQWVPKALDMMSHVAELSRAPDVIVPGQQKAEFRDRYRDVQRSLRP